MTVKCPLFTRSYSLKLFLRLNQPLKGPSNLFVLKGSGEMRQGGLTLRIGGFTAQGKNFFMAFQGLQDSVFLFLQEWADLS